MKVREIVVEPIGETFVKLKHNILPNEKAQSQIIEFETVSPKERGERN